MHKVIKSHVKSFSQRFSMDLAESKLFESFVSYVIFKYYSGDAIEPVSLVYDGDDPGIDTICFFIEDRHVSSIDEITEIFGNRRRDHDVTIVFIQSKTSDTWQKKGSNKF